jgi:hypothetical protein
MPRKANQRLTNSLPERELPKQGTAALADAECQGLYVEGWSSRGFVDTLSL